jgi:hypothetical protein
MTRAEQYRQTATDCLDRAVKATHFEMQTQLQELARYWLDLAEQAEIGEGALYWP